MRYSRLVDFAKRRPRNQALTVQEILDEEIAKNWREILMTE